MELTQKYLKECLTYYPDTGIFIWNERPVHHFKNNTFSATRNQKWWNSNFSFKVAGGYCKDYIRISIQNKHRFAHVLAWLYMTGEFCDQEIDHIDQNKLNNKWDNLRSVTKIQNSQNCPIRSNNTSGVTGVLFHKQHKKWMTMIVVNRKRIYLGYYKNFEDAVGVRYAEEINNPEWTFTENSSAYKYLKNHKLI